MVKLWDTKSFDEQASLLGHATHVYDVAFSPDSQVLASGSADNTVIVWDITKSGRRGGGKIARLRGHSNLVRSIVFSPGGDTLISGAEDNTVKRWRMSEATRQDTVYLGNGTFSSAFSTDGKYLVVGLFDGTLRLLDAPAESVLHQFAALGSPVERVALSRDGKTLACTTSSGSLTFWDPFGGKQLKRLERQDDEAFSAAFSPTDNSLAVGGDKVELWNLETGKLIYALPGHADSVRALAFSPDGRVLASGSNDGMVLLWDTSSAQKTHTLEGHQDRIRGLAFSADGELLASASQDCSVRVPRARLLLLRRASGKNAVRGRTRRRMDQEQRHHTPQLRVRATLRDLQKQEEERAGRSVFSGARRGHRQETQEGVDPDPDVDGRGTAGHWEADEETQQ